MPNVAVLTQTIQAQLTNITLRNSQKIEELSTLPPSIRSQIDTQVFSDMEYLLRYIQALHSVLDDVAHSQASAETFDFD
jgi:hypothetical protein